MTFRSLLSGLVLNILLTLFSNAQNTNGLPLITNFETRDYKAGAQNWGLVMDARGKLLVANNYGLISYDGNKWKLFEDDFGYLVSTISKKDERIFVGGNNSAGFVDADSLGQLTLTSLTPLMADSVKNFGIVRKMVNWNGKTLFHSDYYLFVVSDSSCTHLVENEKIKNIFTYRKNVYVLLEESGLKRLENGQLMPIPGARVFTDNTPVGVIKFNGKHYFLSSKASLYHLVLNKFGYEIRFVQKEHPLKKYFDSFSIKNCYQLDKDRYALNVEGKGLVIVDNWEKVVSEISLENGLQDEVINGYCVDDYGSLWLALEKGISKIDLNYPVRQFNEKNGLEGTVEGMTIYKGAIYAASSAGIFTKKKHDRQFSLVAPLQSWDISQIQLINDSKLLVATNNDIQEIKDDGSIEHIVSCYPWMVKQSTKNRNLVYIGLDPGIMVLRWDGEKWQSSQENPEINEQINNVSEIENKVWYGSRSRGFFTSDPIKWFADSVSYGKVEQFTDENALLENPFYTESFQSKLVLGSTEGLRTQQDGFPLDSAFSITPETPHVHRLKTSADGDKLWAIMFTDEDQYRIGFFDNEKKWNYRLFNPMAIDVIHAIQDEGKNKVWFGGPTGIYEVDLAHPFNMDRSYNAHIRKVVVEEDSVIFHGNWKDSLGRFTTVQPSWAIPEFHYETNGISFEFGALSFGEKEDMTYSYWLEGNDKKWSKWTSEHKKEYTNLSPGEYAFKIKAKNVFETESEVSTYRFVVLKPWFETTWYYVAQTSFFLFLVLLSFLISRSGRSDNLASVIAFVTLITIFEYLIMTIEPIFQEYTGQIPIFNLLMNVFLAMSLVPLESLIKKMLAKRHKKIR